LLNLLTRLGGICSDSDPPCVAEPEAPTVGWPALADESVLRYERQLVENTKRDDARWVRCGRPHGGTAARQQIAQFCDAAVCSVGIRSHLYV